MWWLRKLPKFFAVPGRTQLMLLEAALWLTVSRVALAVLPFRRVDPWLKRQRRVAPVDAGQEALVRRIASCVSIVADRLPWENVCLPRAMAARQMLARRGIASRLHLGLGRPAELAGALSAHAWLTWGDTVLTGRSEHRLHKAVFVYD